MGICIYIYIYIYIYTYIHTHTISPLFRTFASPRMHRASTKPRATGTVSFHDFKSQDFKPSVSNPKSKYVAYLSVLSQISNCQSLGRKNKHEILKTDRSPARTLKTLKP